MPASCADAAHMSGQSSDALGQGLGRTVLRSYKPPVHGSGGKSYADDDGKHYACDLLGGGHGFTLGTRASVG